MMDQLEFRKKCGLWCTGVSVVTTTNKEGIAFGVTLNSFTSLSMDPPLLLVCLDNTSDTLHALTDSGLFCVNVLSRDQERLSIKFSSPIDRFRDVELTSGLDNIPLLMGAIVSFECGVEQTISKSQ